MATGQPAAPPSATPLSSAGQSLTLTGSTSALRRGNLSATIARNCLPVGLRLPFLVRVVASRTNSASLWVYDDIKGDVPPGGLAIPPSTRQLLGLQGVVDPHLSIELPECHSLRLVLPKARDLPPGASAHVAPALRNAFRRNSRPRRYGLLTTSAGLSMPVRLHQRPVAADGIVISMTLRILCGLSRTATVQLATIPKRPLAERAASLVRRAVPRLPARRWTRYVAIAAGGGLVCLRLADLAIELLLRLALRSHVLAFRVLQSNPGDDDLADTIRLHPAAFDALSVAPGGQVILTWADRRVAVRALPDPQPVDLPASQLVLESVGVHLDTGLLPDGFPPHLVARVPAPVRNLLNIPPATVIAVRRRLRPAVIAQLNQLSIPVAGIILAAAAFPQIRGWPLAIGAITACVFGLAPLRTPRPPRGPWP